MSNNLPPKISRKFLHSASIIIKSSQTVAWDVLKDFSDVYTWAPGVKTSYALGDKSHEVGAGRYCDLVDFGSIEEYITHWDEGTGFVYDVTPLGPLKNGLSSWWLSPKGPHGVQLNVVLGFDLRYGLLGRLLYRLIMKNKLKSSLNETLQSFKHRCENGECISPVIKDAA